MGPRLRTRAIWSATKAVYSSLIAQSIRWEVAESFFNSLTRRVFATEGVDQAIEFVDTDFDAPPNAHGAELCRTYAGAPLAYLLREALTDPQGAGFALDGWSDLNRGVRRRGRPHSGRIDGRAISTGSRFFVTFFTAGEAHTWSVGSSPMTTATPLALCLRHPDESGFTLDAVLIGESDLAILFSYTRAYFRVDAPATYRAGAMATRADAGQARG